MSGKRIFNSRVDKIMQALTSSVTKHSYSRTADPHGCSSATQGVNLVQSSDEKNDKIYFQSNCDEVTLSSETVQTLEIQPSSSKNNSNCSLDNDILVLTESENLKNTFNEIFDDIDCDKDYAPSSEDSSTSDDEVVDTKKIKKSRTFATLVSVSQPVDEVIMSDSQNIQSVEEIINEGGQNAENENQLAEINKKRRWRVSEPRSWKRQKTKIDRNSCLPYEDCKGVIRQAKSPKIADCSRCIFKCNDNFSEEVRKLICQKYWALEQFQRKKDFILLNVSSDIPASRRPRSENSLKRKDTKKYYLTNNGNKLRVCQQFFLKTLCISNRVVLNAFSKKDELGHYGGEDKRGKNAPANKTCEKVLAKVKNHIESFPCMESHYVRKYSSKKYLDKTLTINKMYSLYKEQSEKEGETEIVSAITYRRIFCQEYNYSFFRPKKDLCVLCNKYEHNSSPEEKIEMEDDYREHLRRHKEAQKEKNEDKEKTKTDSSFWSVTFDLQSVLQIPCSDVSLTYYKRKLNAFNFTVYEATPPNQGHCFFWTEIDGARGSCEIGSCLLRYIQSNVPKNVKHITFFSDTCGGQNRNQQIAAMFLNLVQTSSHIEIIEQKFLESGHSFMEVDSMHSAIEAQKKFMPVYCVNDWMNILKLARSTRGRNKTKPPYNTTELTFHDFIDLKELSEKIIKNKNIDENGDKINWLKVKCFKYEKSQPGVLQYKYNYSSEYKRLHVGPRRGRNGANIFSITTELKKLYTEQLKITSDKKKDLITLCEKRVIPEVFHPWYFSLPTKSEMVKKHYLPEADIDDDSEHENSFV